MADPIIESFQLPSSRSVSYATNILDKDNARFVLLTGPLIMTLDIWDPVIPALLLKKYNILRYDLPGYGNSGVPSDLSETTFETLADDVYALLDHLGIKSLAWVGTHFGAGTAMTFAAKYPNIIGDLVLFDPAVCSPINQGIPDVRSTLVASAREAGNMNSAIDETLPHFFHPEFIEDHPEEVDRVRGACRKVSLEGYETCSAALLDPKFDLRPLLHRVGGNIRSALVLTAHRSSEWEETIRRGIENGLRIKTLRSGKDKTMPVLLRRLPPGDNYSFLDGIEEFNEVLSAFLPDP